MHAYIQPAGGCVVLGPRVQCLVCLVCGVLMGVPRCPGGEFCEFLLLSM